MRRRGVELAQMLGGGIALGSDLVQPGSLRSGYILLDPEVLHDCDNRGLQFTHAVLERCDPLIVGHWWSSVPFAPLALAPMAQLDYRPSSITAA